MNVLKYLETYYEYRDGKFFWKQLPKYCKGVLGEEVGYVAETISGFRGRIHILGKGYQRSRLIWLYHNKEWPLGFIDHLNGITTDDRICNLRDATPSDNMRNRKINCNNSSGMSGVVWQPNRNKWHVTIAVNKKRIFLGRYSNFLDAISARLSAEKKYDFISRA